MAAPAPAPATVVIGVPPNGYTLGGYGSAGSAGYGGMGGAGVPGDQSGWDVLGGDVGGAGGYAGYGGYGGSGGYGGLGGGYGGPYGGQGAYTGNGGLGVYGGAGPGQGVPGRGGGPPPSAFAARPPVNYNDEPAIVLDPGNGIEETWTKMASAVSKAVSAPVGDAIVSVTDTEPFIPTNVVRQIINVPCLEKKLTDPHHSCTGEEVEHAGAPSPSTAA